MSRALIRSAINMRRCQFVKIDEGTGFVNPDVCAASVPGSSGKQAEGGYSLFSSGVVVLEGFWDSDKDEGGASTVVVSVAS